MKRMTIDLSDADSERLDKLKELKEVTSLVDALRIAIREEYKREVENKEKENNRAELV